MKIRFTAIVFILALLASGCSSSKSSDNGEMLTDEIIDSELPLPSDITEILQTPDSVTWIALDVSQQDSFLPNEEFYQSHAAGYKTVSDSASIISLQNILLDPVSYEDEGLTKECLFVPDLCAKIYSKKNTVDFLFSAFCNQCMLVSANDTILLNGDQMREPIRILYRSIFPKPQE